MTHYNVQEFKPGDLSSGVPSKQTIAADLAQVTKLLECVEQSDTTVLRIEIKRTPKSVPVHTSTHISPESLFEKLALPFGEKSPIPDERVFLKFRKLPNFDRSESWVIGVKRRNEDSYDVDIAWNCARFQQSYFTHWFPMALLEVRTT